MRLLAATLAALLLAGCSDAPAPDEPVAAPGAETASDASPSASPPTAPTPSRGERETPMALEGSTAAGACASVCHYEMTDGAFHVLDADGGGLRLRGTLTWSAVSPTSQELTLYVPAYIGGDYHWEPGYPAAAGPSPLAIDLDLSGLGGVPLGLIVGNGVAAGTPAGVVAVQTPQPFSLEAVYTELA